MTQGTKTLVWGALAVAIIAFGVYALNVNQNTNTQTPTTTGQNGAGGSELTTAEKCAEQGGTWLAQHNECTGVSSGSCKALGGTYNECASACRHDPNATACIQMCVAVCKL